VAALTTVPGATHIIAASAAAMKQAFADSIRVVFIIAAPFGVLACIISIFLGDLRKAISYTIDAPIEQLHSRAQYMDADSTGRSKDTYTVGPIEEHD
jgi:hypothetical protein